ncbi:hypothetical protein LOZ53_006633 [Ophidiomyces ophidiicola]|nr:hypothetical protein LOZ53_006633 [Ophidiomyces ophidiicola]
MSVLEPSSTPLNLRDAPGAFPDQPDDSENAGVASDLASLSRAVYARKSEYVREKKVRIRIGTWNVAALPGTEQDLGKWFGTPPFGVTKQEECAVDEPGLISGHGRNADGNGNQSSQSERNVDNEDQTTRTGDGIIDIFALGLQEIVDVSSPAETLRPYVDPAPSNRWKDAVQKALPPGYTLVSSQQLTGLLLLVYASDLIAPSISSVSSTSVETGLMGYMGNKGAVATRIVLGGTTRVVFVNCHLAAGAEKASIDRRNWDASQVLMRTRFDPVDEEDDHLFSTPNQDLGDEDFAFWFGDLNYRLDDIPGDDVRRLLHLHTANNFGSLPNRKPQDHEDNQTQLPQHDGNDDDSSDIAISMEDNDVDPYQDPASLVTTLSSLLPHDQLRAQQRERKAFFEGWREDEIRFLPTYKYDVGRVGQFDSSEKQRGPSWCDRILFRTKQDYLEYQRRTNETEASKRRDDEMKSLGLDQEAEDNSVLFDYDPELDGADDDGSVDSADNITSDTLKKTDNKNPVDVICYTSHQGIVSSDHKPLHADFVLTYDAIVQSLKANVHQEVARELDKAENEARPDITIVIDQPVGVSGDGPPVSSVAHDRDTVNFGPVRYDVPVSRSLTLANTGSVPATFSFRYRSVAGDEDPRVSPPWLLLRVDWPEDTQASTVNAPKEYTLPPGESAHVQLILCIFDLDFVRKLNTSKAEVEDVLVLRVSNGRDHFISVRGKWLPTCFGFSLNELTRVHEEGIRNLDTFTLSSITTESDSNENVRTSAPRELFRLTEAISELTERAVAEWDMIATGEDNARPWLSGDRAGWPFDSGTWTLKDHCVRYKLVGLIREGLDTGTSFFSQFGPEIPSRHRVELLAETLLSFLRSMPDGLITQDLWAELNRVVFGPDKAKLAPLSTDQSQSRILDVLSSSPAHSVSFTFLTFMLDRIANEVLPLIPASVSTQMSPTTVKTPSIFSARTSTDISEPTPVSPSVLTQPRTSISFPFRLKPRSRTLSSSEGGDVPDLGLGGLTIQPTSTAYNITLARRRAVNRAFAETFANVIFSKDIAVPEKDREKRVLVEKKRSVIEPFLRSEDGS